MTEHLKGSVDRNIVMIDWCQGHLKMPFGREFGNMYQSLILTPEKMKMFQNGKFY